MCDKKNILKLYLSPNISLIYHYYVQFKIRMSAHTLSTLLKGRTIVLVPWCVTWTLAQARLASAHGNPSPVRCSPRQ